MPATPTRAAFVNEQWRSVVRQNDTVRAIYGKSARDTRDEPIETYFDNIADVQAIASQRGALLEGHARAFRVQIGGLVDLNEAFAMTQALPGVQVVSSELGVSMAAAVVSIDAYDTANDRTTITVWGVI